MLHATNEMEGAALDWAVAKCEGREYDGTWIENFSSNWLLCGPIIEREGITLELQRERLWEGRVFVGLWFFATASTPLIAAMRCYVASKLGNEVEIPEELK